MRINTPRLLDQVRAVLRCKHYSLHTEEAYVDWGQALCAVPPEAPPA
jgi:hypothetical protein